MIDFHCHLDLYPDAKAVVAQAVQRDCYVLAVTTTPLAWNGTKNLLGSAPRIRIAVGLHPELVAQRAREVDHIGELLAETKFVGEVGIDGTRRHRSSLGLQRDVFRTILKMAAGAGGRVMSVHSRGAATDVLDELEQHRGSNVPVLHWFSGTVRELRRAIEMGCWFSVGPTMMTSEKGRKLAALMPSDRVLTETDGPFTRNGSDPLFPWDVGQAEAPLGRIWDVGVDQARQRLKDNLRSLVTGTNIEDIPDVRGGSFG